MSLVYLCLFGFFLRNTITYHQNEYAVIHHRFEIVSYNSSYYSKITGRLEPYNRTIRAFSTEFDLLIDLTEPILFHLQVYKFSSNAYRVFPLSLEADYCKHQQENVFGTQDVFEHSNVTLCPMRKGFYYIRKYRPDETKFPPHLPNGDFKIVAKLIYDSQELVESHWYGYVKSLERIRYEY